MMAHPLEPDRSARSEMTEAVLAYLNDWYDAAATMPAHGLELDANELAAFREPPAEEGRSLDSIMADVERAGRDGHMHPSGGHLSYIPNAGLYTGAVANFLAAGKDQPDFRVRQGFFDQAAAQFERRAHCRGVIVGSWREGRKIGVQAHT